MEPTAWLALIPTHAEAAWVVAALPRPRRVRLGIYPGWLAEAPGGRVALAVIGVGGERAELAGRWAAGMPAAGILLAGWAGGLRPGLPVGAVVRPGWASDETGRRWPLAGGEGGVASVAAVAATPAAKAALRGRTAADIVDQEAAPLAAALAGRPLAVLRVVFDGADDTLPAAAADWLAPDGRLRGVRLLADVFRRPALAWALLRLSRASRQAGPPLRAAAAATFAQPPAP